MANTIINTEKLTKLKTVDKNTLFILKGFIDNYFNNVSISRYGESKIYTQLRYLYLEYSLELLEKGPINDEYITIYPNIYPEKIVTKDGLTFNDIEILVIKDIDGIIDEMIAAIEDTLFCGDNDNIEGIIDEYLDNDDEIIIKDDIKLQKKHLLKLNKNIDKLLLELLNENISILEKIEQEIGMNIDKLDIMVVDENIDMINYSFKENGIIYNKELKVDALIKKYNMFIHSNIYDFFDLFSK